MAPLSRSPRRAEIDTRQRRTAGTRDGGALGRRAKQLSLAFVQADNRATCRWYSFTDTLAIAMEKPRILTAKELRVIMPRLSGWKLAQNKLSRTFEFQDFVQSLSFVNSLVAYFETVDHHPDIRIAYGEVTFELTRYDLGGRVTDRDVEVAKKIASLYRARS
jgi:4a-hydroxytetrahydrobiopterin dehydratase